MFPCTKGIIDFVSGNRCNEYRIVQDDAKWFTVAEDWSAWSAQCDISSREIYHCVIKKCRWKKIFKEGHGKKGIFELRNDSSLKLGILATFDFSTVASIAATCHDSQFFFGFSSPCRTGSQNLFALVVLACANFPLPSPDFAPVSFAKFDPPAAPR